MPHAHPVELQLGCRETASFTFACASLGALKLPTPYDKCHSRA